jgi:DNA polymerase alpha subunit B
MANNIDSAIEDISKRVGLAESTSKQAIQTELGSILRIHHLEPEDLLFKWESYCMKMGAETQMDLKTVRDFKKDLNDILERESRDKAQSRHNDRRAVNATPRTAINKGDVFGM